MSTPPAPSRGAAPGEEARMHRFRHLTVALARTAADAGLLRYAATVARLGTAVEVRFVHVLPADAASAHAHDQALADVKAAAREHFPGPADGAQAHPDVLKGPLVDRLLAYTAEQETDVIFLGHRRDHPSRRSLARRLAMKAPCSVWVVPDGSPASVGRILVPVDFSEHAADAMNVALSLARLTGKAECLALHVYFNEARATYEEYDRVLRGREEEAYRQFVAPLDTRGVAVRPLFEEGAQPAHVINRVAEREGADLVVMATRGRSRSAAILLGSVAEEAIIETKVPLLVVKHYGARLGVLQVLLGREFRGRRGPQFD